MPKPIRGGWAAEVTTGETVADRFTVGLDTPVMVGPRPASAPRAGSAGVCRAHVPTARRVGGVGRRRASVLPTRAPEPDVRERDPDLAEHLDRHEEAGEQEEHAQELAELEELRRA